MKNIKKDCYASRYNMVCDGTVKNTGKVDIENVSIRFTPAISADYADLYPPDLPSSSTDKIDYLPAGDTVPFSVRWLFPPTKIDRFEVIKEEFENKEKSESSARLIRMG